MTDVPDIASKMSQLSLQAQEHVRHCLKSRRELQDQDIVVISDKVDRSNWKALANALRFNFVAVEKLEDETNGSNDVVHHMIQSWLSLARQYEKATVGRLAKALFLNGDFEAIAELTP